MKTKRAFLNVACALFLLGSLPSEAATYLVDRLSDADPAGGGEGSGLAGDLRFCLTHAGTADVIGFSVVGIIELTAAMPVVTLGVTIQGPGANLLTVQGAGGSVIVVDSGANVTVAGLAITGGVGNGGGILNLGTLTLNNATVHGNTAGDPTNGGGTGAGIWNGVGATLTLNGSTVSGNSAIGNLSYSPSRGGGIANYGTMTLINSTVSGNSASQGFGGGISNSLPTSTLMLTNSTVSANSSPGTASGGLDNVGTLIAGNSIVAGNENGDLSGDVASEGYNLFGTTDGSGFDPTDLLGVDPLLGPLQDNGGATSTMSPLAGSPAIDHVPGGSSFPATDQRNVSRPQGPSADSGAVEVGGAPGLQVAGIVPHSGAASGGSPVVIAGIGFLPTASLTIGGIPAQNVVVASSSEIDASMPPLPAGTLHDVVVANSSSSADSPLVSAVLADGWLADFLDVPQGDLFHDYVESIFRGGITAGCGSGQYCRNSPVTREQMAVFLLKAKHGSEYSPPSCVGFFDDVPCPGPFADWIEELQAEGITGGCGGDNYCPQNPVTRAQMSAFLMKTKYGAGHASPPCAGVFEDVACPSPFADWIEEIYSEGVTGGCSTSPLLYCPTGDVTRGQMAAFLVRTF